MQYAQIIVKNQPAFAAESYTYAIPPELLPAIKVGQLVLVDFHNSRRPGIIIGIKRRVDVDMTSRLKPIKKIITPFSVLFDWQWQLARWLADYYLAPLAKAVFAITPPACQRGNFSTINHHQSPLVTTNHRYYQSPYFIFAPAASRLEKYCLLVKKSLAAGKQILLLFPNHWRLAEMATALTEQNQPDFLICRSQTNKTNQLIDWLKIASGEAPIILGLRGAVLAPLANPGAIIVDEPENYAFKEDQAPRFWLKTVAKKISQLRGINLIFGDDVPAVEDYGQDGQEPRARPPSQAELARRCGRARKFAIDNHPVVVTTENRPGTLIAPLIQSRIKEDSGQSLVYLPLRHQQDRDEIKKILGGQAKIIGEKFFHQRNFIIQTSCPDDNILAALSGRPEMFYQTELAERKKRDFPPFSRLIELKCSPETKEKITAALPAVKVLGPVSPPASPNRGESQGGPNPGGQILLKIPLTFSPAKISAVLIPLIKKDYRLAKVNPEPVF
ncbi:MAG: primosomal protein N' (replication factor Y) (superfamily II helicase) [Candidatus Berkelbacteria bacterium Licking1014_2]|uniref:Primosomal protein N' (Replication factor Y) (Superfamily II helicase) n=1 Tax=Candidatus Berkelbacteria bacterium Licking1014_2 TaxID=2017146 RepID=A0A554LT06_9BACT|nr:MAG: primosomal protein N' (replication factor Y) (superfamily II helicase) [Candidatus Berkelbacteria bacterium Licking1014_2]